MKRATECSAPHGGEAGRGAGQVSSGDDLRLREWLAICKRSDK